MSSESHTQLTRQEYKNQMLGLLKENNIVYREITGLDIKNSNGPSSNNGMQIQKFPMRKSDNKEVNTSTVQSAKNLGGLSVNGKQFFFTGDCLKALTKYINDLKTQKEIQTQMINFLKEHNEILKKTNKEEILYKVFNEACVVGGTNQFLYNDKGLDNLKKFIKHLNNEINGQDDNSTFKLTASPNTLTSHDGTQKKASLT